MEMIMWKNRESLAAKRLAAATAALALALALTGCASAPPSSGYGSVSKEVVELYDVGDATGMMELEIDRHGVIYEAEADIDPADLPDRVMSAARSVAGEGAVVTGAEIEYGARGKSYEVKFDKDGVGYEFVVSPDGRVLEKEREIERATAPAGIVEAASRLCRAGSSPSRSSSSAATNSSTTSRRCTTASPTRPSSDRTAVCSARCAKHAPRSRSRSPDEHPPPGGRAPSGASGPRTHPPGHQRSPTIRRKRASAGSSVVTTRPDVSSRSKP